MSTLAHGPGVYWLHAQNCPIELGRQSSANHYPYLQPITLALALACPFTFLSSVSKNFHPVSITSFSTLWALTFPPLVLLPVPPPNQYPSHGPTLPLIAWQP